MERPTTEQYDVVAVREHFPSLLSGRAHFDAPGGTQTPEPVARAVYDALTAPLSNRKPPSRSRLPAGHPSPRGHPARCRHPDKLRPSADSVPERYELGTLSYELLAGTTAAVDFLAGLVTSEGGRRAQLRTSLQALGEHEGVLRRRLEDGLAQLPRVTVHSRAGRRTPTLFMTFDDCSAEEVSDYLEGDGIDAPAGTFYAYETARRLEIESGLRIGLAPYSTQDDVDRFIVSLGKCLRGDQV